VPRFRDAGSALVEPDTIPPASSTDASEAAHAKPPRRAAVSEPNDVAPTRCGHEQRSECRM